MLTVAAGDAGVAGPIRSGLPANMGALTSLRGLLAWWVVIFHLAPLAPFGLDQATPLLHKGPVLVDCFFVLSGFVLFHAHPAILSGANPRRAAARFLIARVARLYPTHLAMLAAFALLIGALHLATGFHPADPDAFSATSLIEQLLLLHGTVLTTGNAWNFPSWSISSECAAYLMAPLLFHAIHLATKPALLLAGVVIGLLVASGVETGWLTHPTSLLVLRVTLEFSLGALLRVLAAASFAGLCRIRMPALLAGWGALVLLAPSSHPGLFLVAVTWLMLFLSLAPGWEGPGWQGRAGAVCRYLGETSFAVYMCHAFVLTIWAGLQSRFAFGAFGTPPAALLLLCLSIQGCACLLHHLVELPGRSRVRRWGDRYLEAGRRRGAAPLGQSRASAPGTCASVSPSTSTT